MTYQVTVIKPKPTTAAKLEQAINKAAALQPGSRLVGVAFDGDSLVLVFEDKED